MPAAANLFVEPESELPQTADANLEANPLQYVTERRTSSILHSTHEQLRCRQKAYVAEYRARELPRPMSGVDLYGSWPPGCW